MAKRGAMALATVLVLAVLLQASLPMVFAKQMAGRTYRAAVLQHQFESGGFSDPHTQIEHNLSPYIAAAQAARAAQVQILVYPEFGLLPGDVLSKGRAAAAPYFEDIPDVAPPGKPRYVACDDAAYAAPATKTLSCLAAQTGLVLVANVNERRNCSASEDPHCPADGRYQYNTEIVMNERGELLAKYHKMHPWFTQTYDTPPADQPLVSFETSFGVTFGLMICNDIRFAQPKDGLVAAGVRHFPYSVSMDYTLLKWALIQSFSYLHDVTVLSANAGWDNGAVYVNGTARAMTKVALPQTQDTLLWLDVAV